MVFDSKETAIGRIEYILKNYGRLRDYYIRRMHYYKSAVESAVLEYDRPEGQGNRPDQTGHAAKLMHVLAAEWCFTEAVWHAGEELADPDEYEIFCSLYVNHVSWYQLQHETGRNPNTINRIRKKAMESIYRMLKKSEIVHICSSVTE